MVTKAEFQEHFEQYDSKVPKPLAALAQLDSKLKGECCSGYFRTRNGGRERLVCQWRHNRRTVRPYVGCAVGANESVGLAGPIKMSG